MALAFRHRIFVWLVVIATVPAAVAVSVSLLSPDFALPVGGVEAWERAGDTWREATRRIDVHRLPVAARAALQRHGDEIARSIRRARQVQAFRYAISGTLAGVLVALTVLVAGKRLQVLSQISLGAKFFASPVVANGVLYVASTGGWLWAVASPTATNGSICLRSLAITAVRIGSSSA